MNILQDEATQYIYYFKGPQALLKTYIPVQLTTQ